MDHDKSPNSSGVAGERDASDAYPDAYTEARRAALALLTESDEPFEGPTGRGEGDWRPVEPVALASAPGRLDALGGIADYSGATVLELPLACGVTVAAARAADGALQVRTGGPAAPGLARPVARIPTSALTDGEPATAPERLRAALAAAGATWAAYALGPLAILYAHGLIHEIPGLRLALWSDVSSGAGVSSSAALEVAALRAYTALYGLEVEPLRLARLAQEAEHRVALAPCGVMDQATSLLGRRDALLRLRCQPAELLGYRALPEGVRVFGVESGVAHRVAGGQYGRVRTAAFMGRAIIAAASDGADPPGGYLCNLDRARFEQRFQALLPARLLGAEFLARYGETGDDATRVDPETVYHVRACATHPIAEQANVNAFLAALDHYEETGALEALGAAGEAMYRSHASYSERCELGSPETDLLVALVRAEGPAAGLFGAKITGGGAGGTVAALGAGPGARAAVERVARAYAAQTGHPARVLDTSGEGALRIPVRLARVDEKGNGNVL